MLDSLFCGRGSRQVRGEFATQRRARPADRKCRAAGRQALGGENLEPRSMLTVSASVVGAELLIVCSAVDDAAFLSISNGAYAVSDSAGNPVAGSPFSGVTRDVSVAGTSAGNQSFTFQGPTPLGVGLMVDATIEAATINQAINATNPATSLVAIASPTITLAADVATGADQTYSGAVALVGSRSLTSTSGAVDFKGTVDTYASVWFAAQSTFAAGTGPSAVSIGDLNSDGQADLAVANSGANSVSVLLSTTAPGATAPSYGPQTSFAAGTVPAAMSIGDFNADGKADLAIANSGSNSLSVLLNTTPAGATVPSYAAQSTFATGATPSSLSTADVNGDGKPDLIVVNYGANSVGVLLNTTAAGATTPSFAPQTTFAAGSGARALSVGDVNGDGKPDIVVVNEFSNSVSVLLNTTAALATTPSYAPQTTFPTGLGPVSVAMGDVNGDGKPDLGIANYYSSTVSVLMNTTAAFAATPSFGPANEFAAGIVLSSLSMADFNGDGKAEIVTVNPASNSVGVLVNTTATLATTPSYALEIPFYAGPGPAALSIGDLNSDGKPDLAVANYGSGSVGVLLNSTGNSDLTVSTKSGTKFEQAVGGTNPLRTLAVPAGATALSGAITTTGAQTYVSAVTLAAATTLSGTTITTAATVAGNANPLAVVGNAVVGGAISGVTNYSVSGTTSLGSYVATSGTQSYAGVVTLGVDVMLDAGSSTITLSSAVVGAHSLTPLTSGSGTTTLSGANTNTTTFVTTGTVVLANPSAQTTRYVVSGGTLKGNGVVGILDATGAGIIAPGSGAGSIGAASLAMSSTNFLDMEIAGTVAGTQYDQIVIASGGSVNLGSATLRVSASVVTPVNTVLTIINNSGAAAIQGTFAGLPEGSIFTVNGTRYQISYVGGTGNDVTLQALPPPVDDIVVSVVSNSVVLTLAGTGVSITDLHTAYNATSSTLTITALSAGTMSGSGTGVTVVAASHTAVVSLSALTGFAGIVVTGGGLTDSITIGTGGVNLSAVTKGSANQSFSVDTMAGVSDSITVRNPITAKGTGTVALVTKGTGLAAGISLGTTVTTPNGSQTFDGPVTLAANTTLTGTILTLTSGVAGGGKSLALNFSGTTTIDGSAFKGILNLSTGSGGMASLSGAITTAGTQTYSNAVTLAAATTLSGTTITTASTVTGNVNPLAVVGNAVVGGAISGVTNYSVSGTTSLGSYVATSGTQSYAGVVTLGVDVMLDAGSSTITLSSAVVGAHSLTPLTSGSGTTTLSGANTNTTTFVTTGTVVLANPSAQTTRYVVSGGTLKGNGVVGILDATGAGIIAPGSGAGSIGAASLAMSSTNFLDMEIAGTVAGTQYDQIVIASGGSVNLGSATLRVSASVVTPVNTVLTIINNSGAAAIQGTFAGLPEGSIFTVNGTRYQISYVGGTGNDVTLQALPPPVDDIVVSVVSNSVVLTLAGTGVSITDLHTAYNATSSTLTITALSAGTMSGSGTGVTVVAASHTAVVSLSALTGFAGIVVTGGGLTDSITIGTGGVNLSAVTKGSANQSFSVDTMAGVSDSITVRNPITAKGTGTVALVTKGTGLAAGISLGTTVTTQSGSQTFDGAVTLTASTTLTAGTGGGITLTSTLDGANTLTLSAGAAMKFAGAVGGVTPLRNVTVSAAASVAVSNAFRLSGVGAVANSSGLTIGKSVNNVVFATSTSDRTISGFSGSGVKFLGGSTASVVYGIKANSNGIGLEMAAGSYANTVVRNSVFSTNTTYGISLASATGLTIGGSAAAANTISGNLNSGLYASGALTSSKVQSNTFDNNVLFGVSLSAATGLLLGGTTTGLGNTIQNSTLNKAGETTSVSTGVSVAGLCTGSLVQGNSIRSNSGNGVTLSAAQGITIGGSATGSGNSITSNSGYGIRASGVCTNSLLQGNTVTKNTLGQINSTGATGLTIL